MLRTAFLNASRFIRAVFRGGTGLFVDIHAFSESALNFHVEADIPGYMREKE